MADNSIDRLAGLLAESLPEGLRAMRADLEQNFRAVLKSGIERLDLVTREEFEVQEAVLERTREKLEALEARLASLEKAPVPKKKTARKSGGKKAATGKTR